METTLIVILILMIAGSIHALHAKDLLSAIVSYGVVGYSLVIAFLVLKAPDLAIVQIVVETIALVIMVSVLIISTREDLEKSNTVIIKGQSYINIRNLGYIFFAVIAGLVLIYFFSQVIGGLGPLGIHETRMASEYINKGVEGAGSVNLVTAVLLDYRAYDTLGEATILFTAVMGVLAILRIKTRKT
ncbi:MAG: hydrogen gas-evolving membrane-bound hydrogenase subunit E [Bacteroidales bacterium]